MSIVRTASPTRNFMIVSNDVINDSRLSLEARGLLLWLLSKPDNWKTNSDILAAQHDLGRDRIRRLLRQLSEVGYMKLATLRNEAGRLSKQWMIFDSPEDGKPATGNPGTENPGAGDSGHFNKTELTRTDLARTKKNTPLPPKGYSLPSCPYDEIIAIYHETLPNLPQCKMMSEARKKKMRDFWQWVLTSKRMSGEPRATNKDEALKWIMGYFEHATKNDFLMGRVKFSNEHSNWKCDFDFLLTERGKKHVIEKTQG